MKERENGRKKKITVGKRKKAFPHKLKNGDFEISGDPPSIPSVSMHAGTRVCTHPPRYGRAAMPPELLHLLLCPWPRCVYLRHYTGGRVGEWGGVRVRGDLGLGG